MDKKQSVLEVISSGESEGLTYREICTKLTDVTDLEANFIIEDLDRGGLVKMVPHLPGIPKYCLV